MESRFEALRSEATQLIGRDEELELLMQRWQQAKDGEGRVILVSGSIGWYFSGGVTPDPADKRGRGRPAGRLRRSRRQRSSASRPVEASTVELPGTRTPVRTHARWLGAKRGANSPSLISRVTAKRLKAVGGRNKRSLFGKPSDGVSMSPSAAEMMPSPFWSTRATSAA